MFELQDYLASEPESPVMPIQKDPYEAFHYDQYNWSYGGFNAKYVAIKLTQGYFTIISKKDERRVRAHTWCADVQRDPRTGRITKIYATCRIMGKKVYLHRFLAKAGPAVIVDHFNGLSLDNRRRNLRGTNIRGNNANRHPLGRRNACNAALPRGVERRGEKYGAQIKLNRVTYRSGILYSTPEAAHRWYLRKYRLLHAHRCICEMQLRREYPIFPPLNGQEEDWIPF